MILDERTEFADAALLNTGAPARFLLGDTIDLGSTSPGDLGNGEPMYLVISIDTAVTSGGAGTAEFILVSDAQAGILLDGTATQHVSTGVLSLAQMAVGRRWVLPVPLEGPLYERHLGVLQVTGTAALTGGRVNAYLTNDPVGWRAYPDAAN